MKKLYLFFLTLLLAFSAKSQQKLSYEYDAAGNRTSRTIVIDTRSASATGNPEDSVFYEKTLADKQVRIYPNPVETQLTIKIRTLNTANFNTLHGYPMWGFYPKSFEIPTILKIF